MAQALTNDEASHQVPEEVFRYFPIASYAGIFQEPPKNRQKIFSPRQDLPPPLGRPKFSGFLFYDSDWSSLSQPPPWLALIGKPQMWERAQDYFGEQGGSAEVSA